MPYNRSMKINRKRKKSSVLPVFLLLLVALAISLIIAGVWQAATGEVHASSADSSIPKPSSEAASSVSEQAEQSSVPISPSEPETQPVFEPVQGMVPEAEQVDIHYFDDAVFVGDSITTGIELYGVMENTDVLAGTGVNLLTVYTAQVVKLDDGSRITIMDGLKNKQYQKVYVMLGGNEVRDEAKEQFIKNYTRVIDDIRKLQPNATLYIQSITPVTKVNNYKMDNQRIDEFNEALLNLCVEKGVYYLNVAECMKDENGMLPDAASPADGMHFGPEYYNKWFDYLMQHTIPQPGSNDMSNSSSSIDTTSSLKE